ncbi:hypothetical protein KK137_02115 [Croceibacterium sp. LX-88]|uniref:SPW repeat-containing protein n=1 Tax=Croceibacterium selenioxidans TaxID=2838833 RepID=A0ABS5W1B7_9SPHN|nr:hypothetical protein [Croceibacterium selenioxidans]MBT2133117.1 hypothetical protein [Croceibacterium selenioxidans]
MKDRILAEPAFGLGVLVWIVAATLFPYQLGMSNAPFLAFILYLTIAGHLLAVADALFNSATYRSFGDVAFQGLFWAIGLSIPAFAAFLIGASTAPVTVAFEDDLCRMAGFSHIEGHPEAALEEALEPTEGCETES